MSYKTLLVSLNDTDRNPAVLSTAREIARRFEAHVAGLYVIPTPEVYALGAIDAPPVVLTGHRDLLLEQESAVRASFEETLAGQAFSAEFKRFEAQGSNIADALIRFGRAADLLVVSQTDASDGLVERDLVERLSLAAGRPLLVVPREFEGTFSPDVAVLGWNGRREAARAAFDSLPLLKLARETHVVWVDPPREAADSGGLPGADVARALARHGVHAAASTLPGDQDAGEALLTKARDAGAGLLVVGAYGHTRLREFILGGATRTILQGMTCPVLFSH